MNAAAGAAVHARWIGDALLALVLLTGCAPKHVQWRDSDIVIQPQAPRVEIPDPPSGHLVVEMRPGDPPGGESMPRYPRVYVYSERGHFLNALPNNTEYPTAFLPGEYIVLVDAGPLGQFRRVQVRIEDSRTTSVSLADIKRAPGL